jgi:hypothetical protein
VNDSFVPTYAAFDAATDNDLSYNAFEKELLLRLLAPNGFYSHERPGFASTLTLEMGKRSNPPFLPLEKPPKKILSIGQLDAQEIKLLAGKHHRPKGSGWSR